MYSLTHTQREFYRDHGFITLERVFSSAAIASFERAVTLAVDRLKASDDEKPPNSDSDIYAAAFTQVMNLWRHSAQVKSLVFNRELARIAAELMGVAGVRLYHDQALYKEGYGGITPWHCDQYYWPLDSDNTITVWIPLQDTDASMGTLGFAAGSHLTDLGRNLPIGEDSERLIAEQLQQRGLRLVEPEFRAGDVSFHAGWTMHRAGANATSTPRRAMTIIYMEDGIRLKEPENANQENDRQTWCPGARVGEVVATPLNPLLYCR